MINSSGDNKGVDDQGYVCVVCPIKEAMGLLNCSNQTAINRMVELETIRLLKRKRVGLGKPNLLYVLPLEGSENNAV